MTANLSEEAGLVLAWPVTREPFLAVQPPLGNLDVVRVQLDTEEASTKTPTDDTDRPRPKERIQHDVSFFRSSEDTGRHEIGWERREMGLWECLRVDGPHGPTVPGLAVGASVLDGRFLHRFMVVVVVL